MKLNSQMGYRPVTFSELTDDEEFWAGCKGCVNYDILQRNNRRMCLCTGMLYDPKAKLERPSKSRPYMMWLKTVSSRYSSTDTPLSPLPHQPVKGIYIIK